MENDEQDSLECMFREDLSQVVTNKMRNKRMIGEKNIPYEGIKNTNFTNFASLKKTGSTSI